MTWSRCRLTLVSNSVVVTWRLPAGHDVFDPLSPGYHNSPTPQPTLRRETSVDITSLLRECQNGDRGALDRLIPIVYDELHVIAARHMAREWRTDSVETTGLVNEAYMKLVDQRNVDWQNRAHFFAIAAQ